MKLFEVANPNDAVDIASVIKGLANDKKIPSEIPFNAFKNYIKGDEVGIGTPEALQAWMNLNPIAKDVIDRIEDNGTVVLKTKVKGPSQNQTAQGGPSPTVDQMASSAAKKAISPKI